MKDTASILLAFCLTLPIAKADEKNLQQRFELIHPINGTFSAGQQGRIVVPDDVFAQSHNFPHDLRIFDDGGTQWPFFLYEPKQREVNKTLTPEVLNPSFVEGAFLQFDLVVPAVDDAIPVHNQLELKTSGRDFVRRVEIFGDTPQGLLATGYLIDFSRQRNAQSNTIRYPDSDLDRLYVRIYPNAQEADETFELISASLHDRTKVQEKRETVHATPLDVPENERAEDAQTQLLDIGHENRPVEWITFDVTNESYARSVAIYGRNADREPWSWVGGGEIHALADDTQNTIRLSAQHRYLKVRIYHYDDAPLQLRQIQLEATPRQLIFEAATTGKASLYYRAWNIYSPRYDLEDRIEKKSVTTLPSYSLKSATPNVTAKKQPWRKYSKVLGALAVSAVSLLVMWVIVSMLRQNTTTK